MGNKNPKMICAECGTENKTRAIKDAKTKEIIDYVLIKTNCSDK